MKARHRSVPGCAISSESRRTIQFSPARQRWVDVRMERVGGTAEGIRVVLWAAGSGFVLPGLSSWAKLGSRPGTYFAKQTGHMVDSFGPILGAPPEMVRIKFIGLARGDSL